MTWKCGLIFLNNCEKDISDNMSTSGAFRAKHISLSAVNSNPDISIPVCLLFCRVLIVFTSGSKKRIFLVQEPKL